MTLRWRIALILAAVALTVGGTAALASYVDTANQLRSSIDDTLRSRAAAVNTSTPAPNDRGGRDNRPDNFGRDGDCPAPGSFQPASSAQLVAVDGTITDCIAGGPILPVTDVERSLPAGRVELRTLTIDGERYRMLSTRWHDGGTLQIARTLAETDSVLSRLRLRLGLLVAAAVALAAAIGWFVATGLVRPIVRLRDATHRIATTHDLATPIDVGGSGEVRSLASSFATMVAEVGRAQRQQRRLVSDASHEMRTPLTSLRSNLELLEHIERLPSEERAAVISDVLEDVDELSTLLAELVELASDLTTAEDAEAVQLADLARTVAARAQRRTGRHVVVVEESYSEVVGRPRQLERAIANLVDNAIKYSEPATEVEIAVHGTTVTVSDRGRGIPEGDLDRIFDRFYRAVEVRSEPGSGLGLSIVDEIVRSHSGRVFARNREGGGASVGFAVGSSEATGNRSHRNR